MRSARAWRWGGLLLLALTTPLVLANLSYYDAAWHALVFNRTLAAFAIFVAALWLIARTYARSGEAFEEALSAPGRDSRREPACHRRAERAGRRLL